MRTIAIALVALLSLGGCVRTSAINFAVPAPTVQMPAAWSQAVKVSVSVSDKRLDKTNIGRAAAVNGQGQYIIHSQTPLDEAVRKGVVAELEGRGVRVSDGPAFLLVDIVKADSFNLNKMMTIEVTAEAELEAQVLGADGRVHHRQTYRRRETGNSEFWTMDYVEQGAFRLQTVMGGLIREMFEDMRLIQALMDASK